MKLKIVKCIQMLLLLVALFAANTPSQHGLYQAECPKKLKRYKKH